MFSVLSIQTFFAEFSRQIDISLIQKDRYKLFLKGLGNTVTIALFACVFGALIGIVVALLRSYHKQTGKLKAVEFVLNLYVTVFRATPILVQLAIMYFIIFKSTNNEIAVAILAFSINSGAYMSEIMRGGIMAIDIGQTEAGRSLGLSTVSVMRLIVLPQAIKSILPALGNEFIALFKETSIVGVIAVTDLMRASELVRSATAQPYIPLLLVAFVYLIIVIILTSLLGVLERALRKSDRG